MGPAREPTPASALPVHLAEPDPGWAHQFAEQAELIRDALGERVETLEHVGSTSVPGLAAKPIIDVLLLVADPTDEAAYVPHLEAAGFLLHLREPGWHEHRLLRGTDPTVNLHVLSRPGSDASCCMTAASWQPIPERDSSR